MPHALVVGAGIAGLASAIALRRVGWSVELFDRVPDLEPVGAALSLWSNGMAALRLLGAAAAVERGAASIKRMQLRTVDGVTLVDRAVADARLPSRPLLQSVLRDVAQDMPLTLNSEAVSLDPEAGAVRFAGGVVLSADLVVVADGIHSELARAITDADARYCGYRGVVALSDMVGIDGHEGLAAEYWGRHERFGLFDLGAGKRYWFWMETAAEDAPRPNLFERAKPFPTAIARALAATPPERWHDWPLHAKPPPRRLAQGKAICVGDAAHAMEPNLGQGACQALEDAVALGMVARDAEPAAVPKAFEALRLFRARQLVRRSAEAGLAVHGPVLVQSVMRAGLRVAPGFITGRAMRAAQRLPDYGQSSG